jgi:hypothetical protein
MSMSDIANIKIDVDAHLCLYTTVLLQDSLVEGDTIDTGQEIVVAL